MLCAVEDVLRHADLKYPILKHSASLAATHSDAQLTQLNI